MSLPGLFTVNQTAAKLGLTPGAVRNAISRRVLRVDESVPGRNFISEAEIERYRSEVQGTKGWKARKTPGYLPDQRHAAAQQKWRTRKQTTSTPGNLEQLQGT